VYFNKAETKGIAAGGGTAVGAITAACTLIGSPVAGGVCAAISGAIIATAQGANSNGNCLGRIGYGMIGSLGGMNPFIHNKGTAHCK
jgi:hypothetical protein